MDRIELATQLISKGVELLDESYGTHGTFGKVMEEQYKKEKAKNDKIDAEGKQKANRFLENNYRYSIEEENKLRRERSPRAIAYSKLSNDTKPHEINTYAGVNAWRSLKRDSKIMTNKQKALHNKINNRAKSQNETVADLLTEAAYLLSLVDNDDE